MVLRPTTGVPLAHATMNFVGLDLTTSDRWHQKTTTTTRSRTIRLLPASKNEKCIEGNSYSVCRRGEGKSGRLTEEGDM
ncbi:hypothetical protein TNCV_2155821 [Trichonephila clavipes]|nr:hypothetical protein TNCV_2155821 [Trichonephila clavipes]